MIGILVTSFTYYKYSSSLDESDEKTIRIIDIQTKDTLISENSQITDNLENNETVYFWSFALSTITIGFSFILTVTLKLSFISFFPPFVFTTLLVFGSLGVVIDIIKNKLFSSWMLIYPLIFIDIFLLTLWNLDFGSYHYSFLIDYWKADPSVIVESIGNWSALLIFSYLPTFFREPKFRFEIAVVSASILTKGIILIYLIKLFIN